LLFYKIFYVKHIYQRNTLTQSM